MLLPTHKTGNPALTLIQHVEALAPGISLLSRSPLALHVPLTTKDAFQKTPWIGNLALAPTIPALVAASTKTKLSTCFHANLVLGHTRPVLLTTQMTGRLASTLTTNALVAALGLPRRPYLSLHVCSAPTTTDPACLIM